MLVIKGQCTNVNRYVIAVLSIIPGIMMTFKLRKEWYWYVCNIQNDLESNEKNFLKLEKKLIIGLYYFKFYNYDCKYKTYLMVMWDNVRFW